MVDLTPYQELHVKQEVEPVEIFTPFETRNRYRIVTPDGDTVIYAFEESGFWGRQLLRGHRPLTINLLDPATRQPVVRASRKFFWFFSHLHMRDSSGRHLGSLQRRFGLLTRRFTLEQADHHPQLKVRGPVFRPNTFIIEKDGSEIARITKMWGGFLKEAFTRADKFKIEFGASNSDTDFKLLALCTAIAVDLDIFEGRSNRGGFSPIGRI